MTPRKEQTWVIVVEQHQALDAVAALEQLGFRIEQKLDSVGIIIAQGSSRQADEARKITSVVDISLDAPIDIGPTGAKLS